MTANWVTVGSSSITTSGAPLPAAMALESAVEVFSAVPVLLNLTVMPGGWPSRSQRGFPSSSCRNPSPRTRVRPCQRHPCWRRCRCCCRRPARPTSVATAAVARDDLLGVAHVISFWTIGVDLRVVGFLPTGFRFSSGYFSVIFRLSLAAFRLLTTAFRLPKTNRHAALDFNSFGRLRSLLWPPFLGVFSLVHPCTNT